MNETLAKLIEELKGAGSQARWAIAACVGLVLIVAGTAVVRAKNPHMVVLESNLDSQSFNAAATALANAGIHFEPTTGGAPYAILVDESQIHDARIAVHISGEFLGGTRGISSGINGSSSVLLGQTERRQRSEKRLWEEAEIQLERLNYVAKAKVTVSGPMPSPLARLKADQRRASIVLTLRGLSALSGTETRALVGIVRGATGVMDERITIVDQHSNLIFDGKDAGGAESLLELEQRYGEEKTDAVQRLLDRTFGPGLTVVGVTGSWSQVQEESISETLDPGKKPRTERTRSTETPEWPRDIGGPAGVAANTQEGTNSDLDVASLGQKATTTEEERQYAFGSKTTHTVSQPHRLERISISLVLDESIQDRRTDAEAIVKGLVGFDQERGDVLEIATSSLHGIQRDEQGAPVLPDAPEPPAAANPTLELAMQYGLEIVSGLAFLFVLLRSLKSARSGGGAAGSGAPGTVTAGGTVVPMGKGGAARASGDSGATDVFDDEVDLDALARAHIEELLREEPEKVSALLSRWALAEEDFGASARS
ncbi:MAG: flagellar M-ring protein FliF C-terminal domain-containing protein [Planctomycetota bacterium]